MIYTEGNDWCPRLYIVYIEDVLRLWIRTKKVLFSQVIWAVLSAMLNVLAQLPVFTLPLFIYPPPELANRCDYYSDELLAITEELLLIEWKDYGKCSYSRQTEQSSCFQKLNVSRYSPMSTPFYICEFETPLIIIIPKNLRWSQDWLPFHIVCSDEKSISSCIYDHKGLLKMKTLKISSGAINVTCNFTSIFLDMTQQL